jgi:riboflavin kinase, archaea type
MTLRGVLTSGVGRGSFFTGIDWVRDGLHRLTGFEPYPGTLNLQLVDEHAVRAWGEVRARATRVLVPPVEEMCGAHVVPVVIEPGIEAAVVVPDVTDHPGDLLEVVAAIHVRARLGLRDGDVVTLTVKPPSESR